MRNTFLESLYSDEEKNIIELKETMDGLIERGDFPERLTLPLGIQLELTENCNLTCKHCYNNSGSKNIGKNNLKPREWVEIANHIVSHGGVFQVILSGGEPLLLGDHLFDIMDIFHNDGCRFILITNGYLLDDDKIERLKKYNFAWLQISIDGTNADVHDDFRQKEGSWQRAISAAVKVSHAGIPLKIASSLQPSEIYRIEDFVSQAYHLGASSIILGDIMPSGRTFQHDRLTLNEEEKVFLFKEIIRIRELYQGKIDIQTSSFIKLQLQQASIGAIDSVIIRPNGDVRLDCIAPFTLGNVKTRSFKTIWDNLPGDVWSHSQVQKYISTVDKFNGSSDYLSNYKDNDILITDSSTI